MQRVLVLGSSGSGKSTFAIRLAGITGLPMISIDAVYWQPGWTGPDLATFSQQMTELAQSERWIMDGNYQSHGAGELRRSRADTVFWFDLPRHVCMTGILTRIARSYGRVRPEMAPGCPERFDAEFFRYVWTYRAKQRPKLLAYLDDLCSDQSFVTFSRRTEANDYLAALARTASPGVH